ncbi:MAG TPA: hypothetical protein VFD85_15650 [Gemmatimonadales bacterium]|nr:hypothetical protein [Gemmatimonadales bacterium]
MNATWRIGLVGGGLLAVLGVAGAPRHLVAQDPLGAELWRVAGTTVAVPFALAQGTTSAFWNPAQTVSAPAVAGDVVQTPDAISATSVLAVARTGPGRLGSWGLVYGQVDIGDITRTSLTPDPEGTIPIYTRDVGLTWARAFGSTTLGATVGAHDSRLDQADIQHWTGDVGVTQRFGDVLTLAAATHFFYRFSTSDASQDLYAGVEWRALHGPLWTGSGDVSVRLRYGATLAHGAGTDHAIGVGLDFGAPFALDGMLVRESSFGNSAWRGVAGLRVKIGRYGLSFARDAGVSGIGSSYRVGLEARFK